MRPEYDACGPPPLRLPAQLGWGGGGGGGEGEGGGGAVNNRDAVAKHCHKAARVEHAVGLIKN